MPRILFLSASVGVGHSAAAAAVSGALADLVPAVETQTVDSYKYAAKMFSKVVADGYIGMVKTVPQLYRYIYERAERARDIPAFRRWVSQYTAANLRTLVTERKPDLVVCTHAFPCGVMSEYKRKFDPDLPVVGVVTDFAVHPFWIYPEHRRLRRRDPGDSTDAAGARHRRGEDRRLRDSGRSALRPNVAIA